MDNRGYSLLEMMVALAVIGISGAIVTQNVGKSSALAKAQFEAEKVRDALTRARNLARFRLKCVTVDVQPDHIDITPYDVCLPLGGAGPTETIPFEGLALTAFDTGNPLTFNTMGGTVAPSVSTMTAVIPGGKTYEFIVMPAIGTLSMR
jgi:prepilin-type N-terminal cleavage/methylation domain-containing protein